MVLKSDVAVSFLPVSLRCMAVICGFTALEAALVVDPIEEAPAEEAPAEEPKVAYFKYGLTDVGIAGCCCRDPPFLKSKIIAFKASISTNEKIRILEITSQLKY